MKTVEEYYEMKSEEAVAYLEQTKELIQNDERFKKLTTIVENTLTGYEPDYFIHDMNELIKMKSNKYIWIVRELGTHLVALENEFEDYISSAFEGWNVFKSAFSKRGKAYLVTAGETFKVKELGFDDVKENWFVARNGKLDSYLLDLGYDPRKMKAEIQTFKCKRSTKEEIQQYFLTKNYEGTSEEQYELAL